MPAANKGICAIGGGQLYSRHFIINDLQLSAGLFLIRQQFFASRNPAGQDALSSAGLFTFALETLVLLIIGARQTR